MSEDAIGEDAAQSNLFMGVRLRRSEPRIQVLTDISVGVESGWHMHPGEEVGYILAGTVQLSIEGEPTLILNAGDPFLMPPRRPRPRSGHGDDAVDLHRRGRRAAGHLHADRVMAHRFSHAGRRKGPYRAAGVRGWVRGHPINGEERGV
jgi:hypothetical protein